MNEAPIKQRSMRELRAIVASNAARLEELHEAWDNMTEREQVALVENARRVAFKGEEPNK